MRRAPAGSDAGVRGHHGRWTQRFFRRSWLAPVLFNEICAVAADRQRQQQPARPPITPHNQHTSRRTGSLSRPVDNFYERKKTATWKQPYAISLADRG